MTIKTRLGKTRLRHLTLAIGAATMLAASMPASAYLFWVRPALPTGVVKGDEQGITVPLPGATPAETQAGLIWGLRAGLNVAALQCQFAPALMTVRNYNEVLKQHDGEFDKAQAALSGYFKKKNKKGWQRDFDAYSTRVYNGFSTLHGQLSFCEVAGSVGRDAVGEPKGKLHITAENRMLEFRSSLLPIGDRLFAFSPPVFATRELPSNPKCWKRGELRANCAY